MKRCWQLREAKNRLSEVIGLAEREGPQTITVRGKEAAVVVSASEYARLVRPKQSLVEILLDPSIRVLDNAEADELFRRVQDYGRPAPDFTE